MGAARFDIDRVTIDVGTRMVTKRWPFGRVYDGRVLVSDTKTWLFEAYRRKKGMSQAGTRAIASV